MAVIFSAGWTGRNAQQDAMTITPFAGAGFWFTTTAFITLYTLFKKGKAALRVRNSFMIGVSLAVISLTLHNSFILLPLLLLLTCIVFFYRKISHTGQQ